MTETSEALLLDRGGLSSFLAGGFAGVTVDVALFPLDFIKTHLQATRTIRSSVANASPELSRHTSSSSTSRRKLFSSPLGVGFSLLSSGSNLRLYTGLSACLVGAFPSAAAFFWTYDASKAALSPSPIGGGPMNHILSACAAEVVACCFRVPSELIKQQMQVGLLPSLTTAVRTVYSQAGLQGFFVGYGSTLLREVPFDAIQFVIWEKLKARSVQWKSSDKQEVTALSSAVAGSIAGGIAGFLTTPFDVLKTRLMTQPVGQQNRRVKGTWSGLTTIYRTEGLTGLFAGAVPRVLWISIGGFVFFGSFTYYKQYV